MIFDEELVYQIVESQSLETFVPKCVVKKYIVNERYKEKVLSMWKNRVNPLEYKRDNGILRFLMNLKIKLNYIKAYKENSWDWD